MQLFYFSDELITLAWSISLLLMWAMRLELSQLWLPHGCGPARLFSGMWCWAEAMGSRDLVSIWCTACSRFLLSNKAANAQKSSLFLNRENRTNSKVMVWSGHQGLLMKNWSHRNPVSPSLVCSSFWGCIKLYIRLSLFGLHSGSWGAGAFPNYHMAKAGLSLDDLPVHHWAEDSLELL